MNWNKTGHTIHGDGSKEIQYEADGTDLVIETRRRPVEHANGVGSWLYTSYFLIRPDGAEKEFHSLRDAKAAAEKFMEELGT